MVRLFIQNKNVIVSSSVPSWKEGTWENFEVSGTFFFSAAVELLIWSECIYERLLWPSLNYMKLLHLQPQELSSGTLARNPQNHASGVICKGSVLFSGASEGHERLVSITTAW